MSRVKFILPLIATCGLAVFFIWEHETRAKLKAENRVLGRQLEQLLQAQSQVAQPSSNDKALAQEQMSELLKLRGEVTQLCEETNEIESLREKNQKLLASLKALRPDETNAPAKKRPEDALPQDIHPRDSWAFRGYDSPDATAESMCWAVTHGDKAALQAAFSPELQSIFGTNLTGISADEMKSSQDDFGEFRILDRKPVSDDEVVLTMYMTYKNDDGDYKGGSPSDMIFKKIGGEWKIAPNTNSFLGF